MQRRIVFYPQLKCIQLSPSYFHRSIRPLKKKKEQKHLCVVLQSALNPKTRRPESPRPEISEFRSTKFQRKIWRNEANDHPAEDFHFVGVLKLHQSLFTHVAEGLIEPSYGCHKLSHVNVSLSLCIYHWNNEPPGPPNCVSTQTLWPFSLFQGSSTQNCVAVWTCGISFSWYPLPSSFSWTLTGDPRPLCTVQYRRALSHSVDATSRTVRYNKRGPKDEMTP